MFFSRTRCPREIDLSRTNHYSYRTLSDDRRLFAALCMFHLFKEGKSEFLAEINASTLYLITAWKVSILGLNYLKLLYFNDLILASPM